MTTKFADTIPNPFGIEYEFNYTADFLFEAIKKGDIEKVSKHVSGIINFEKRDRMKRDISGNTPLHVAVYSFKSNRTDILKFLLDKYKEWGILKNALKAKDEFGNTALHMAIAFKNEDAVRLLLHEGASPDIKNKDGNTPYNLAQNKYVLNKENIGAVFMEIINCKRGYRGTPVNILPRSLLNTS